MKAILFIIGCVFTQNVVFVRLLGACALGEDRRIETAIGYGLAATAVMALASLCVSLIDSLLLVPMGMEYLRLAVYMAIIIAVTFVVEKIVVVVRPALAEAIDGGFLTFAANCAVLGIAVLNVEAAVPPMTALVNGLLGGLGFLVAIVLMAGVQERLEASPIPEAMKGLPITLVSASMIALALMGFMGIS